MPAESTAIERRRTRERDIVDAARRLFDERGGAFAPMDEIARAVGINRALIYRYFESRDELYVLTVTRYMDELTARGVAAVDPGDPPAQQLRASWETFTDYCLEHPAFLDCALSLMREPADDLRARVSDRTWFTLALSMTACLGVTIDVLRRGVAAGVFDVDDPAFTANILYSQTLGTMHMARTGIVVSRDEAGMPGSFPVESERVREACIQAALRAVGVTDEGRRPRARARGSARRSAGRG